MTSPTVISELLSQLCSVLHTEEFRERHRRSAKDFVRDRILTLTVMFFLRLRVARAGAAKSSTSMPSL